MGRYFALSFTLFEALRNQTHYDQFVNNESLCSLLILWAMIKVSHYSAVKDVSVYFSQWLIINTK